MDNELWFDIGATEYDQYEDQQAIMNELYPPYPIDHTVQFNLFQFEDIPF
jgi:hypothetical protein